jgi:hypothetical protein
VRRERRKMRFPAERRNRRRDPLYLLSPSSCFLTGKPAYSQGERRNLTGSLQESGESISSIRLQKKREARFYGKLTGDTMREQKALALDPSFIIIRAKEILIFI